MKLNKKGWGYKIFIIYICALTTFLIVANHYIVVINEISKIGEK